MNTPKLRFKEFSGDWESKKLEQLALVERGKFSIRPRNDPRYFGGSIPFVQTGDVVFANLYLTRFSQTLNEEGLKVSRLFPKNTILITIAANIGDTTITKFDVACTDSIVAIQPYDKKSNSVWLKSMLDTKKDELDSQATQNAQKNINLQILKPLLLNTPTFEEQTKIANFLTAIDDKINQLSQKVDLLSQYKKGVMQQIFSQQLRFKDDDGKNFDDWEEKSLGEVFAERSERCFPEMELLSVTTNNGVKKRSEIEGKDNSSEDKSNYKRVLKDDIVYNSMRMWQGACSVSGYDGIVSPAYTVLKSSVEHDSLFFGYLFKTKKMIQVFERNSQGLTSDTWNLKYPQLSSIKVTIPSNKKEQTKIANFLTAIDDKITQTKDQLEAMKLYKKGLLQQMFV